MQKSDYKGSNPHGCAVQVILSGKLLDIFQEINKKTMDLYDKYGIQEPPEKGSKMDSSKKISFFVDFLEMYDAGSNANKGLEVELKYSLNRRFNNGLKHAMDTFAPNELRTLYSRLAHKKIGDFNR